MARPQKKAAKIIPRDRGGATRYYGDFRAWKDAGGKVEALVPPGATLATSDPAEAERLYHDRIADLNARRRKAEVLGSELGIRQTAALQEFAAYHLRQKAKSGLVTAHSIQVNELQLRSAIDFFGASRELHTIRVPDIQSYANWLATQAVRRGKPRKEGDPPKAALTPGTQRKYLNSLSNLFRRAQSESVVAAGYNPVAAMMDKPVAARKEASWLEVPEAALLLESARTYKAKREDVALPFAHPLVATFLLTGGRESEILGLEVGDISFDRKTVTFRPNAWRRLKTATSHRTVPLWPQLEEILRAYLFGGDSPIVTGLLFPSHRAAERGAKGQAMLTDWRKALDAIAERAGWQRGEVRTKQFRHGYCAARLQTLDNGAPVSVYTVAKELGHGGDSMVKRVYGHLGTVRHRSEVVEFRVDQHREALAERLAGITI